jgi:hypothetical protein
LRCRLLIGRMQKVQLRGWTRKTWGSSAWNRRRGREGIAKVSEPYPQDTAVRIKIWIKKCKHTSSSCSRT